MSKEEEEEEEISAFRAAERSFRYRAGGGRQERREQRIRDAEMLAQVVDTAGLEAEVVAGLETHPGLAILPRWFSDRQQQWLAWRAVVDWAGEGCVRNKGQGRDSLRWVTLGGGVSSSPLFFVGPLVQWGHLVAACVCLFFVFLLR